MHGNLPADGYNETTGSLVVMSAIALAAVGPHTIYLVDGIDVGDGATA